MLLASCGTEIKFHRWPSADYHGSYTIPEAGFYIPSISWCSEGELLVTTVPSLGPPIVISVGDAAIQTYQVIDLSLVQAAAFSRTVQKNIAFGLENGNVLLYDILKKSTTQHLPSLPCGVKYLEYGAQDTTLVAGCRNGQIILYAKNAVCSTFYVPNSNSLTAMSCHAKVPHILSAASAEGVVVVWDSNVGNTKFANRSHSRQVTDISFSYGEELVTVGLDEKFNGYDLRMRACAFSCKTDEQLSAVQFMPRGDKIAVGTINGKLFCYDKRQITSPMHTIVAHYPKAIGRIAFQTTSDFDANERNETLKSHLTTVVYKSRNNETYSSNLESPALSSRNPSTITADIESEWQPGTEEYTIYLDNLQGPSSRGDVINNENPRLDCVTPPAKSNPSSGGGGEYICTLNKTTGVTNLMYGSPVQNSLKPMKSSTDGEIINLGKSDTIVNSWIKSGTIESTCSNSTLVNIDDDIIKLRHELHDATKDSIEQLSEMINKEFLKIRLAVSRGFVQMEYKMNTRWREFNTALMKFAGCDVCSRDGSNGEGERDQRNPQKYESHIPKKTRIAKHGNGT